MSAVPDVFLRLFLLCQKQKAAEAKPDYQDTVDPEYEDFRAEASIQRGRQLESFSKAAEAFQQGRKEVASFYAQQVSSCRSVCGSVRLTWGFFSEHPKKFENLP